MQALTASHYEETEGTLVLCCKLKATICGWEANLKNTYRRVGESESRILTQVFRWPMRAHDMTGLVADTTRGEGGGNRNNHSFGSIVSLEVFSVTALVILKQLSSPDWQR